MKTIKSVDILSFAEYGAILAGLWTLVYGLFTWILGWIFGAQAWWIDMNLASWSAYTLTTFFLVFVRALFAAVGGILAGAVVGVVYNWVARVMGGIKINLS